MVSGSKILSVMAKAVYAYVNVLGFFLYIYIFFTFNKFAKISSKHFHFVIMGDYVEN